MSSRRADSPPIDHAAARELLSAIRDLNAVTAILLEIANTFDECAAVLADREPVTLWRTATLARTAATQLVLSLVGVDAGMATGASDREGEGSGVGETEEQSAFLRFVRGPGANGGREGQ